MSKVVLITGASRGIGAATALQAGAQGYAVGVNYVENRAAAERVVRQIEAEGSRAVAIAADTSSEQDVERMFETVDAEFGTLSALVNNAGIFREHTRLDELSAERIQRIFAVNITGCFFCAREAVRRMSTRHGGSGGAIVNVSSAAARLTPPGEVDYAASKAALDAMTRGLAGEVAAEGIRVNCVCPGIIATEIFAGAGDPQRLERAEAEIPMRRIGSVEDVARTILWLLSDEASYTTGSFVEVSGGR